MKKLKELLRKVEQLSSVPEEFVNEIVDIVKDLEVLGLKYLTYEVIDNMIYVYFKYEKSPTGEVYYRVIVLLNDKATAVDTLVKPSNTLSTPVGELLPISYMFGSYLEKEDEIRRKLKSLELELKTTITKWRL